MDCLWRQFAFFLGAYTEILHVCCGALVLNDYMMHNFANSCERNLTYVLLLVCLQSILMLVLDQELRVWLLLLNRHVMCLCAH